MCRSKAHAGRTLYRTVHSRAAQSDVSDTAPVQTSRDSRWEWLESSDSVKAHTALVGCLALGAIPWTHQFSWACVVYFIALASCTIYIGAHKGLNFGMRQQLTMKEVRPATACSLCRPVQAGMALHVMHNAATFALHCTWFISMHPQVLVCQGLLHQVCLLVPWPLNTCTAPALMWFMQGDKDANMQGLLAPFIASVSLLTLYILVTYFPNISLQQFMDFYFFLLGSFSISSGAASLLKVRCPACKHTSRQRCCANHAEGVLFTMKRLGSGTVDRMMWLMCRLIRLCRVHADTLVRVRHMRFHGCVQLALLEACTSMARGAETVCRLCQG